MVTLTSVTTSENRKKALNLNVGWNITVLQGSYLPI